MAGYDTGCVSKFDIFVKVKTMRFQGVSSVRLNITESKKFQVFKVAYEPCSFFAYIASFSIYNRKMNFSD